MVNPVTPNPKPAISLASGVNRGRPGSHGQLAHAATADRPDARIGFATSAQYPHPVKAMAMAMMLLITLEEISMAAMRLNCIALRISAKCCADNAAATSVNDETSAISVKAGSP